MTKEEYSTFKRCMEWYCCDPQFREKADRSPETAIQELGYAGNLDCEAAFRAIRWIILKEGDSRDSRDNPYIKEFCEKQRGLLQNKNQKYGKKAYASEKLYAYEQQALTRCGMENRLFKQNVFIRFYPFAFELSSGCSVQCPFCGLLAKKHESDFLYNDENIRLFRDIVSIAYRYAGPVLGASLLYFATEPMDNPDYEKFLREFREITGEIPQTTTALADKHPQRISRLMDEIGDASLKKEAALRISIRSLAQFKKIAAQYEAQKLADVELISNNPESLTGYSDSGRAREKSTLFPQKSKLDYSICCISGMKVNMVERSVEFIEPEIPDEVYPKGYQIKDHRHFDTAEEFERIVRDFDESYVHSRMPRNLPLCFNKNTAVETEPLRFIFRGDACGYQIGRNLFTETIVSAIKKNQAFADAAEVLHLSSEDEQRLYQAFNELFIRGYIRVFCK